jgi:hypothetical protein
MAYGLKYELLCTTVKGNLYKVKILFDGYTGDPIDRNVPLSPFKLKKDKADYIRGTSLDYSIIEEVDFEFLEFYTNKTKAVKVELYDPSNVLIWTGYNLPQQYQVPYTPSPVNVTFSATDGLGLLKNESFTLTGFKSLLEIVCYCVDKIGLGLGYSIAINLFATLHDPARSPLEQTYINSEVFQSLNCYDVLENVFKLFNAEITQRRGRWAITRSADKKSTRMLYTSAGVYETTEAGPAVLNLGYPGPGIDVTPKNSLQFSLEPGGKQVKISQDYGRNDSLLKNHDFSQWSSQRRDIISVTTSGSVEITCNGLTKSVGEEFSGINETLCIFRDMWQSAFNAINISISVSAQNIIFTANVPSVDFSGDTILGGTCVGTVSVTHIGSQPAFWGKLGTFTPEQRFVDENPIVFIPGNNDTSDCLYQDIEIEAAAGEDFHFSVEMGVLAYRLYGGIPIPIPVDLQFNVALIPVGGTLANAKFLSKKDGWVDTLTSIITTVTSQSDGVPKMNPLNIISHEIPFSGTLHVSLYRIQTTQLYNYFFTGVAWGNVILRFTTADGKLYPTGLETLAEFPGSTEPNNLPDIELLIGEAPDLPNAALLYRNILFYADHTIIK